MYTATRSTAKERAVKRTRTPELSDRILILPKTSRGFAPCARQTSSRAVISRAQRRPEDCSRMAEEEGVPAPAADPVNTLVVQDGAPKPAGGDAPKEGSLEETLDLDSAALFSTRRPKDVSAGMASGAKTIMKGVVAGAIGLVAAPVMGAREEGVKGFVKGVGMGVAGAIALPVAGTILGCVQVTRGALNTPDAIKQRKAGKVWDEDTRQWVVYNLREEARELLSRRATLTLTRALALALTLTLTLALAITLTLALTLPLARRASCSRRVRWSGASSKASLAAAASSGARRRRGGARSRRRSCTTCSASRPRPRAPTSRRPTTSGRGSCTLTRTAATPRHTPTSRRL